MSLPYAALLGLALAASARADIQPGLGTPLGPAGELLVLAAVVVGTVGLLVRASRSEAPKAPSSKPPTG